MRKVTAGFGGAVLAMVVFGPVLADVPVTGTFTATEQCPAYQSFRKATNPGDVKVELNKAYDLLAKNKPDATHYRIVVQGAQPQERWVALSCGRVEATDQPGRGGASASGGEAGDASGVRATHVLAISWQPAFCASHGDKSECRALASSNGDGKHLSLHGLWPQPRGTQYCNVAADVKQADRNHDWNALPEPEMSAETRKRLADVMPGVQSNLQRHEWIVHGTCYGSSADSYFARAAGLAEAVDASKVAQLFADNTGRSLSAEAIRAAFDEAFGSGAGARVAVSCHGRGDNRKITELTIGLAGDVAGTAALGDLMRAAKPIAAGCPSGLVDRVQ